MPCSARYRSTLPRSGPSPSTSSAISRPAGTRARTCRITRISGTGRLRLARRIAVTNRTTPSSGRGPWGRHAATSMPLGSTDTGPASPRTRRSGAAATSDTALMAIPPAAHRRTTPSADTTVANRSSMQCHVIAVGRPIRRVRNGRVHRERADHAHVHVGHVEGRQPVAHRQRRQRVDRQVPRAAAAPSGAR